MKKLLWLVFVAIMLGACSAQEQNTHAEKDEKITAYVTVYPLQYFAERIAGDLIDVQSIYPAGANEHSFEPTQKDMMTLADADVFFYIGQGLEGFVTNAQKTLQTERVKFVPTASTITEEDFHISTGHVHDEEEEEEHHHGHEEDTHVWLSPVLAKKLATVMKDELIAMRPAAATQMTSNYDALIAELDALHAEFAQETATFTHKTFFVSHAAFGYIAGHYGLQQVAIAGLNSQSEPSQKELMHIVDKAKKAHVRYIFFEQNISSNLTSVIQQEIGAEALTLHNLSVRTPLDIKNNEDYFSLMRRNMIELKKALQ